MTDEIKYVPADARKKIGPGGCLWGCSAVLVLTILVPALMYMAWSRTFVKKVDEKMAAIRAKGQPTTPAELEAFYASPPAGKDATDVWSAATAPISTEAFGLASQDLPIVGDSQIPIPPPGQTWEQLDDVETLLAEYAESMALLHEAARMGGAARYDTKFEDGFAMLLEHSQRLRSGARMLSLEAHARAHRGDAEGAAESINACILLARSLENEPLLVSQLVSLAIHSIGQSLIAKLVPHVDFSDEDLAQLQESLRSADFVAAMHRAFQGERAMGIHAFRNPQMFSDSGEIFGAGIPFRKEDLSMYIDLMTRQVDALEQPWPQARKEAEEVSVEIRAIASSPINRLRYMATALVMPATEMAIAAGARVDASRRSTDTMIAVERFRRRHGNVPETLTQLVPDYLPEVPVDPFDSNPIRYVVGENEVVIYSIGKDNVDNGGQSNDKMEPDIVVRFPFNLEKSD